MKTENQKPIKLIEWLCNKAGIEYKLVIITVLTYISLL